MPDTGTDTCIRRSTSSMVLAETAVPSLQRASDAGMCADNEAFVERVVAAVPDLEPLLDEHLDDNFGELLPHPFFWDIARWTQAQDPSSPEVDRLLRLLDAAYDQESDQVSEMIHVSFLEELEEGSWVWTGLGPHLSAAGRQIHEDDREQFPPGPRHG